MKSVIIGLFFSSSHADLQACMVYIDRDKMVTLKIWYISLDIEINMHLIKIAYNKEVGKSLKVLSKTNYSYLKYVGKGVPQGSKTWLNLNKYVYFWGFL